MVRGQLQEASPMSYQREFNILFKGAISLFKIPSDIIGSYRLEARAFRAGDVD